MFEFDCKYLTAPHEVEHDDIARERPYARFSPIYSVSINDAISAIASIFQDSFPLNEGMCAAPRRLASRRRPDIPGESARWSMISTSKAMRTIRRHMEQKRVRRCHQHSGGCTS